MEVVNDRYEALDLPSPSVSSPSSRTIPESEKTIQNMSFPSLSVQKATAAALIAGYNAFSIDLMLAPRAPDCVQQVLPTSLGLKAHNNEEYRRYYDEQLKRFFTEFKVHHHQNLVVS